MLIGLRSAAVKKSAAVGDSESKRKCCQKVGGLRSATESGIQESENLPSYIIYVLLGIGKKLWTACIQP